LANTHIRVAVGLVVHLRNCQMISNQSNTFELTCEGKNELFFEDSVSTCDNDINIAAEILVSPVRTTGFDLVQVPATYQFVDGLLHNLQNRRNLISRNLLSELLDIF
jgi:hypothetical protein